MKKLVLHAATFATFWAHYAVYQDRGFIDRLASLGYGLFLSNQTDLQNADYILFSEATSVGLQKFGLLNKIKYVAKILLGKTSLQARDVYAECQASGLYGKTAMIALEGVMGLPENHLPELSEMFPVVFTWNDTLVDGKRFLKYRWPQPTVWPRIESIPYNNKKVLVNISANKYASHSLELYAARRNSIRYFERQLGEQFDLYGIGWNIPATRSQRYLKTPVPLYSSYKGQVTSKATVFPRYRFALCYENAVVPGWITEKIFDCMRSDCVPIYWGAPNITDYVDAEAFVDRRRFKSDAELEAYLLSITEQEYERFQTAMQAYLQSERFAKFLSPAFADTIIRNLELDL